jgi:chromosome segregation ATPase
MDSETVDEIKRHFDAVAGGLRSEIRIVAGGLVATNEKLDRTNERLDRTAEKFDERLDRLDEKLDRRAGELDGRLDHLDLRTDEIDKRLDRLDEKLDRRTEEIKRHFNVVAEELRSQIRTVAEGFVATNERLDRFEVQMSEGFDDVKSIIRLSFGDLDRRVQSLEKGRPT